MLAVEGLSKRFGGFLAVNEVSFEARAGEILGLIGPNGSGKTTTFNLIAGTLRPTAGSIRFEGAEIAALSAHAICRQGIARTFQIPRPFRKLSLGENVALAAYYGAGGHISRGEAQRRATDALDLVGLPADGTAMLGGLGAAALKKLELARALVAEPEILIADEAMAGLSEGEIDDILSLLFLLNERGVAIIMIEHIMHAVMRFSERVICLQTGRIIAEGTPFEITSNPVVQQVYFGEQTYH